MKKTIQETIADLRQKVFIMTSQLKEQMEARKDAEQKLEAAGPIFDHIDICFGDMFGYDKAEMKRIQWDTYQDSLENAPEGLSQSRAIFHRMIIELIDMFPDPK